MKNKKIIGLLFISLFFSYQVSAQFGVWATYTATTAFKYETFDQFRTSYNKVNSASMKKEMPMFRYGNGFSTGVCMHHKAFYIEITGDLMRAKTTGEFTNGEKREIDLRQRLQNDGFGFGGGSDQAFLFVIGGIGIGQMIIHSSFIYNDGTQSFGMEKSLNGHFANIYIGTYYGITTGFGITKNIKVMLRAIHNSALKYDSKRNTLSDIHFGKALGNTIYPDGLPTDYEAWLNQGLNYPVENYTAIDLRDWRIFIGLEIEFGNLGE